MKLLTIIICFAVFTSISLLAQIEGESSTSVSKASLQSWSLPINEQTDKTLKLITTHYKYSLTVFFEVNGIAFPEGAKCSLNSKKNVVEVFNTHQNTTLISMILGDIMMTLLNSEMTPEKYLKAFTTPNEDIEACFPVQGKPRIQK